MPMRPLESAVRSELGEEPIHLWFGLSYSSYLVLPRSILQAMPIEWQRRMVACLEEIREIIDCNAMTDMPDAYRVTGLGRGGRFVTDPYREYRRPKPIPMRVDAPPSAPTEPEEPQR